MIKTKKVYEAGFYILESKVAANGNYIENIEEANQLLIYARYFMKDYLVIHDYIITRHGWHMAVKINSKQSKDKSESEEYWRQISERVRLFISIYAKRVNHWRKRSGTLVHSNYSRYYFETLEEATSHLNKMRSQKLKLYQKKKKYRGVKYHYRIDKILEKGSIFLCSKELREGGRAIVKEIGFQSFWGLQDLVGPELINFTLKVHRIQTHTKKPQNSS